MFVTKGLGTPLLVTQGSGSWVTTPVGAVVGMVSLITRGYGSELIITQGYGFRGIYVKVKKMVLNLMSSFNRLIKLRSKF